jgi:hypothetical protein
VSSGSTTGYVRYSPVAALIDLIISRGLHVGAFDAAWRYCIGTEEAACHYKIGRETERLRATL